MATKKAKSAELVRMEAAVTVAKKNVADAKTDSQKIVAKGVLTAATTALGSYRFKALAGKRVTKVLSAIANVTRLAGRGYVYTPEQVAKIKGAIGAECVKMDAAFSGTPKTLAASFEI